MKVLRASIAPKTGNVVVLVNSEDGGPTPYRVIEAEPTAEQFLAMLICLHGLNEDGVRPKEN